jgi:hypothetical protein
VPIPHRALCAPPLFPSHHRVPPLFKPAASSASNFPLACASSIFPPSFHSKVPEGLPRNPGDRSSEPGHQSAAPHAEIAPSGKKLFHVLYSSINGRLTSSSPSLSCRIPPPMPLISGDPSSTWNTAIAEPNRCLHAPRCSGELQPPLPCQSDSPTVGHALNEDLLDRHPPVSRLGPHCHRHTGRGDRLPCTPRVCYGAWLAGLLGPRAGPLPASSLSLFGLRA